MRGRGLVLAGPALPYHVDGHEHNGHAEYLAQHAHIHALEQSGSRERAEQHADHDRTGEARNDDAALDIDDGRGTGRDTHHKVGGGGAHLEGHLHQAVHGQHLEHSRPDAEDARQHTRHIHDAETASDVAQLVGLQRAVLLRPRAEELEAAGRHAARHAVVVALAPLLHGRGEEEYGTVDDGDDVVVEIDG